MRLSFSCAEFMTAIRLASALDVSDAYAPALKFCRGVNGVASFMGMLDAPDDLGSDIVAPGEVEETLRRSSKFPAPLISQLFRVQREAGFWRIHKGNEKIKRLMELEVVGDEEEVQSSGDESSEGNAIPEREQSTLGEKHHHRCPRLPTFLSLITR